MKRLLQLAIILAAVVLTACNPLTPAGFSRVTVDTGLTLSSAGSKALQTDVDSFRLTVTAEGITLFEQEFTDQVIDLEIEAGFARTFTLDAMDVDGNLLFSGSTTEDLTAGETVDVEITLDYAGFYVAFNTGGAAEVPTQYVAAGEPVTFPASLSISGYSLTGWYVDSDFSTEWVESAGVESDMTLYAKWSDLPVYTVTFDSNGGSEVSQITGLLSGSTISAPASPTKSGYAFSGWYKDAGLTDDWIFASDTVTANTTLYAEWIELNGSYYILGDYHSLITPLLDANGISYTVGAEYVPGYSAYIITNASGNVNTATDVILQQLIDNNCNIFFDAYFADHSVLFDTLYPGHDYGMSRQYSTVTDGAHYITSGYSGDIVFSTYGGRIVTMPPGTFTELMSYGGKTALGYLEGASKIVYGGTFFIFGDDFPDHASVEAEEIFIRSLQWLVM